MVPTKAPPATKAKAKKLSTLDMCTDYIRKDTPNSARWKLGRCGLYLFLNVFLALGGVLLLRMIRWLINEGDKPADGRSKPVQSFCKGNRTGQINIFSWTSFDQHAAWIESQHSRSCKNHCFQGVPNHHHSPLNTSRFELDFTSHKQK